MGREQIEELLERGYRYALALTHDRAQAEDLLHDAWVAIHRGSPPRDGRLPYLLTTIRNRFIDGRRRQKRFPLVPMETDSSDPVDSRDLGPIDAVDLDRALAELRTVERELLYLTAVEGYTVREAAEMTGRPLGTVSSLLRRAKGKLRELLLQRQPDGERRSAP